MVTLAIETTETRQVRVLCVDDNRDAADMEAAALVALGYDARACYDGPTALRMAADFDPDACLIDLNMPGMDGDELAGLLRAQAHGGPPLLVAVTGMSDEAARLRIDAAGFNQHLVKPAELGALVAAISGKKGTAGS